MKSKIERNRADQETRMILQSIGKSARDKIDQMRKETHGLQSLNLTLKEEQSEHQKLCQRIIGHHPFKGLD
jgi:hypothetical protein